MSLLRIVSVVNVPDPRPVVLLTDGGTFGLALGVVVLSARNRAAS
jgi:hypothetical protein